MIDSADTDSWVFAKVVREVEDNEFAIRTSQPHAKVSWQVTGIRQDAWANAHRIPVEEDKLEDERGYYIHPELYGQTIEESISWQKLPPREQQDILRRLRDNEDQSESIPPDVRADRDVEAVDPKDRFATLGDAVGQMGAGPSGDSR